MYTLINSLTPQKTRSCKYCTIIEHIFSVCHERDISETRSFVSLFFPSFHTQILYLITLTEPYRVSRKIRFHHHYFLTCYFFFFCLIFKEYAFFRDVKVKSNWRSNKKSKLQCLSRTESYCFVIRITCN